MANMRGPGARRTRPAARRPPSVAADLDALYAALSALARESQFRDRQLVWAEGLTVTECYALEALVQGGPLSVTGVAQELRLNKSTASRALDTLVRRGLATRADDPEEHRAWRVWATPRGRAVNARMAARVKADFKPLFEHLAPAHRRRLVAFLWEVARATRRRIRRGGMPSHAAEQASSG